MRFFARVDDDFETRVSRLLPPWVQRSRDAPLFPKADNPSRGSWDPIISRSSEGEGDETMMTPMKCYFLKKKRDMPEVFFDWVDPSQCAVVSIDMHRGHLGDEPDVTCPAPRGRAIIERHNWFARVARQCGVPMIHVQLWLRADGIDVYPPFLRWLRRCSRRQLRSWKRRHLGGGCRAAREIAIRPRLYMFDRDPGQGLGGAPPEGCEATAEPLGSLRARAASGCACVFRSHTPGTGSALHALLGGR